MENNFPSQNIYLLLFIATLIRIIRFQSIYMKVIANFLFCLSLFILLYSCQALETKRSYDDLSPEFKDYWYSGVAELNSYDLEQIRYGEKRMGTSVLIFVTEPFSDSKHVKVNEPSAEDISVMKLNFTKKFNTGIYPYSMMASIFHPVWEGDHVLKTTASVQEWCGQSYVELQNKGKWNVSVFSYFEDENEKKNIGLNWLEDELWTLIRIDPERLPLGELQVIPGLFYQRLMHVESQSYSCKATMSKKEGLLIYLLEYPDLERTLQITFTDEFPYSIQRWEESYPDGGELMTSSGQLIRQMRSSYWKQNRNKDVGWRDSLFRPMDR